MDEHIQSPTEIIASLEKRLVAIEAQSARIDAENTLLKQLYERAPLAYQSLDCNGCFIEVNQAWLETLGYTRAEVIGKDFGDFLHPDWQDHFKETFPRFKAIGEILGIEFEMIKKDGSPILVSFHGKIGKNQEGHFQQTHCIFQDMTRRKQEEEALRESEERFRAIHNASFGGILIHDQGIILDCNQGLSDQTGYSVEELIGMDGLILTSPDYRDLVMQNIQRDFEQPYEIVGLRKDGTRYPVTVRGTNIPYKGRTVRMTEFRDITEFKKMEEALEKRLVTLTCPLDQMNGITFEDLFNPALIQGIQDEFAAATGVASIITHPDGTPITVPSNFTHLCNEIIRKTERGCSNCIKSDAAIGRYHPNGPIVQPCLSGGLWDAGASITVGGYHVANWLIGQVRDETQSEDNMRAYAREIGVDEAVFMEAFLAVPSMSQERFRHIAQALFILANQLSCAAYQNVQQARSIIEHKRIYEALQESEKKYRLIFDSANDAVFIHDMQGQMLEVNPMACDRLGYTHTELISSTVYQVNTPEAARDIPNRLDWLMKLGELTFETEHKCKNGKIIPVEVSSRRIEWEGQPAIMSICRDITERKRAKEQLLAMNSNLERMVEKRTLELQESQKQYLHAEKLSAIGKLSASIAHEFNNPLQGITSILKGLKKRAILEPEDKDLLDAAISESARMKNLIQSLQDFNRPSSGRKEIMDVHKTLDSILLLQRSDFNRKRISVLRDYSENLPQIFAVIDQIKQVFLNLLTNAVDACQKRDGVISIRTWQEEDRVAVAINDNCMGIKPENMERIFQPFFTTKPEVKGTGLGLSVSYGIVKKHQGEIRVESQLGEGATFTVMLPIKGADEVIVANDREDDCEQKI